MTKASTILEYLQHIGARKEAEMYLKLFRSVEPHRFAIIAINAQSLAVHERDVSSGLAYLSSLGLTPIALHDATGALGKQLASDIWAAGGKCQAIMAGLYSEAEMATGIAAKAKELAAAKTIPLISAENTSAMLMQLLKSIKPRKLMFLNGLGGIKTEKGELLSYINLPNEYERIKKIAGAEYKGVLKAAADALAGSDWKLHVEIVPPNGLLTELFTIKGSGTFIKKGPMIAHYSGSEVDKKRIKALLEESFGKKLESRYLAEIQGRGTEFFVEESYKGAAIVKKVNGICYIDKLAVLPEVQGEGLARDLITSVMNSSRKAFWRARPENHINEWYFRLCSGVQKVKDWYVYWSNLDTDEIEKAIKYASGKPVDFVS